MLPLIVLGDTQKLVRRKRDGSTGAGNAADGSTPNSDSERSLKRSAKGRIVAVSEASGRCVHHPGMACDAGQRPVAMEVSAGAVDEGNTVRNSIVTAERKGSRPASRSTRCMPKPSSRTNT